MLSSSTFKVISTVKVAEYLTVVATTFKKVNSTISDSRWPPPRVPDALLSTYLVRKDALNLYTDLELVK